MASLIAGYEYDILISYRHNDNKYDGWVTDFVNNLSRELEATFKEKLSICFSPDPLTDSSFDEKKLRSVIFIPVLSRTYCDDKSLTWNREFLGFLHTGKDPGGLDARLKTGNSGRILPVRIHDLDPEDKNLLEKYLPGIQSIDFVYRSAGVNRPLRSNEDHPQDNLNKTYYRDQINKVANAIDNIFRILQGGGPGTTIAEDKPFFKKPAGFSLRKVVSGILVLAILVVAAVIVYQKLSNRDDIKRLMLPDGRISVAVMPFQNLSNDSTWNIWQSGIQSELISSLTNSKELVVRQSETVNTLIRSRNITSYASLLPSVAGSLSQKLDANVFVLGNIMKAGDTIRLNAQLINSVNEEVYKSFRLDGPSSEIMHIIDSLSGMVKSSLIISNLTRARQSYDRYGPATNSADAYRYYLYGEEARGKRDYATAKKMFLEALRIDTNYYHVQLLLSVLCTNVGEYSDARKWNDKVYANREKVSLTLRILIDKCNAGFNETPFEGIKYLRQFTEIDDQYPGTYYDIGLTYLKMYQYEEAIPEFEKALALYEKWEAKPWWIFNYSLLGEAYHKTGRIEKEKELYLKADRDFPNDPAIMYLRAVMMLSEGDTVNAASILERYKSARRERSWNEAGIAYSLGLIHTEAGMLDKAEEYHRLELSLEPKNGLRMHDLAWFLINNDRNIDEGMDLINKALKTSPEHEWFLLDCKGWGLYKQGKYREALEVLERCRKITVYYRHNIILHIETVKKALESDGKPAA